MIVSLNVRINVLLLLFTCVLECAFPPLGGYLSLMAGIQLAWQRLAKERTSRTPSTHPQTPSSSSRMKLYSGHSARHGPRHLRYIDMTELRLNKICAYGLTLLIFNACQFRPCQTRTCLLRHLDEQHWTLGLPESSGEAGAPSDTTPPIHMQNEKIFWEMLFQNSCDSVQISTRP